MKNAFDFLINILDMTNEKINKLEDLSIKTKTKKTKRTKIKKGIFIYCGTTTKYVT